jgi:hypothetical protein
MTMTDGPPLATRGAAGRCERGGRESTDVGLVETRIMLAVAIALLIVAALMIVFPRRMALALGARPGGRE